MTARLRSGPEEGPTCRQASSGGGDVSALGVGPAVASADVLHAGEGVVAADLLASHATGAGEVLGPVRATRHGGSCMHTPTL